MSSQPPYDPYSPQIPPTQHAQQSEYIPATPYPPQPSDYAAPNSYPPQPADYAAPNPYQPAPAPMPVVNSYGQPVYAQQPVYPYPMMPPERGRGLALAGMILGIISMVVWLLPFLGYPVAIVGLILSILGRRSVSRKGMALTGIILSSIALALTLLNSILGILLAMHR